MPADTSATILQGRKGNRVSTSERRATNNTLLHMRCRVVMITLLTRCVIPASCRYHAGRQAPATARYYALCLLFSICKSTSPVGGRYSWVQYGRLNLVPVVSLQPVRKEFLKPPPGFFVCSLLVALSAKDREGMVCTAVGDHFVWNACRFQFLGQGHKLVQGDG